MASIDIDIAVDCHGERHTRAEDSGEQIITIEVQGDFDCVGLRPPRDMHQTDSQPVVTESSRASQQSLPDAVSSVRQERSTPRQPPVESDASQCSIKENVEHQFLVPKARASKPRMPQARCQVCSEQPATWNQYCSGANLPQSQWNYIRLRKKNPILEDCYLKIGAGAPCKNTM